MIGNTDDVYVRLEIEFKVIAGELDILEQNYLDHQLERLITMWGDQVIQTKLMVLLHESENPTYAYKGSKRNP